MHNLLELIGIKDKVYSYSANIILSSENTLWTRKHSVSELIKQCEKS